MSHSWINNVLTDIEQYAIKNDLHFLVEHLRHTKTALSTMPLDERTKFLNEKVKDPNQLH